jgi:hypothetical protein
LQREKVLVSQSRRCGEFRGERLELLQLGAVGKKLGGGLHGKDSSTSDTSSSNTGWLLSARSCSMVQAAAFS